MTDLPYIADSADDGHDRGLPQEPLITLGDFRAILTEDAPFADLFGLSVEAIGVGTARFRMTWQDTMRGPGNSIIGAATMALADLAIYGVVLGVVGKVPLAVTTQLNVDLVRRAPQGDIIAEAYLIRAGRRLVTCGVWLTSAATGAVIAHATGTYSVPPPEKR
jgi:uncharacterized protein (TIGR00369 family)